MASEDDSTVTGATVDKKLSRISEKRNEMLKELQNQVDEVDRTMGSLANSFDTLYNNLTNSSEEMQRNIKHQQEQNEQNEDNTILMKNAEKMSDLIQTAKDVQHKKVDAMKTLSKLIHFIHADREEICNDKYLDKCKSLTIDKYLSSQACFRENGDTLVEMLQEQNDRLQLKYRLSREHVQIVSEREQLLNNERNQLREKLKALRKQSAMESSDSITYENDYFSSQRRKHATIHHPKSPIACSIDREVQTENSEEKTHEQLQKQREHRPSMNEKVPFHSFNKSVLDRHTAYATERNIDREVQTDNSEEKSLQQLEKQIEELQSMKEEAEVSLAEKERLLRSVVCRNVYEVNMVHHSAGKPIKAEMDLIVKMNDLMEKRGCFLNVKKKTYVRGITEFITIVTCFRDNYSRTWDSVLKNAAGLASDPTKTIIVVFYESREKRQLEDAMDRMCGTLDKYRSVLQLYCSNYQLFVCQKEIDAILQIIVDNGNGSLEVVSCDNCKKR